jgi:glycosyltransferase involved in cell wall biosynthesis
VPPRVTVIIPTFNWSSVLRYSIGSVCGQTFRDWELLVVGDGCTDDSGQVVAAIGDPRIRWINLQPRAGHQTGPNNEGLRQAAGDIVAYLGHDDLWLPHHLAVTVAAIDAGADLAHTMVLAIDSDGGALPPLVETRAGWMPPSGVVHRRALIDDVGPWRDHRELSVGPEHDLWLRIRAGGYRMTFVPRLTAIKFPASLRRNVYQTRPCHEQARWLERIRSEPDLEARELVLLAVALDKRAGVARLRERFWRLLTEPSQWWSFVWRRRGARIKARQRFKGVQH